MKRPIVVLLALAIIIVAGVGIISELKKERQAAQPPVASTGQASAPRRGHRDLQDPEAREALERIDDKTYGQCLECGEPIAERRLRAKPHAALCVECQREEEQG